MSSFTTAVALVLAQEGGLVNNPADPGGLTKFGISQRAYPTLDIANLTQSQAEAIYMRDYWRFGLVADQRLANLLMSMSVNMGLERAVAILQRVVGTNVDGKWGAITEGLANTTPDVLVHAASAYLMQYVLDAQGGDGRLTKYEFLKGWFNRVVECLV